MNTYYGLQENSPPLPTSRCRRISNVKPCPNWGLINRGDLTDLEFTERYLMMQPHRSKMLAPHHRRLIPETAWEDIVDYSILKGITTWQGNGDGKCPLPHYCWRILRNTGIQYWNKNKVGLLDSVELDRSFMEGS